MSRKGNCWDDALAESFFSSLKQERIQKHVYRSRELRDHHNGVRAESRLTECYASSVPLRRIESGAEGGAEVQFSR